MGLALLIKKCIDKTSQIYRRRVVAVYTHLDVSTLRILRSVDIVNTNVKTCKNVNLFNNVTIIGNVPLFIRDYTFIGANTLFYALSSGDIKIAAHINIALTQDVVNSYISLNTIMSWVPTNIIKFREDDNHE